MAAAATAAPMTRGRRILVWTLVVLATVLALVSILTTWVNRQMLDNAAWKKATTQSFQDPQVQAALATYTINALYANVDVGKALGIVCQRDWSLSRRRSSARSRQPGRGPCSASSQRPKVQRRFIKASTMAHQKLVTVLENKTNYGISTGNGVRRPGRLRHRDAA